MAHRARRLLIVALAAGGAWAGMNLLFPCPSRPVSASRPGLDGLDSLCLSIGDDYRLVSEPAVVSEFAERIFSERPREDRRHEHCVICGQSGHITGHRADGSLVVSLTYAGSDEPGALRPKPLLWRGFPAAVRADDQRHCYPLSRQTVSWLHDLAASQPKLWGWWGEAPSIRTSEELKRRLSAAGLRPLKVLWFGDQPTAWRCRVQADGPAGASEAASRADALLAHLRAASLPVISASRSPVESRVTDASDETVSEVSVYFTVGTTGRPDIERCLRKSGVSGWQLQSIETRKALILFEKQPECADTIKWTVLR
jgi:hypothetical protein